MKQALRLTGFRFLETARRRLRPSAWPPWLPLARYAYVFDLCPGIVVPELELCFVPTPKVANRSMKAAIASAVWPGFRSDPHQAPWRYQPVSTLERTGFFRFGFVRNPLDRLYSCYAQKIVFYGRLRNMPLEFGRYGSTFRPDMSFAEFVHAVAAIPDRIADRHFRSQHRILYRKGQPVVDFTGRFENLERDWEHVRRHRGLPVLGHHNCSPRGCYTRAYTPELARIAAERYEKDIMLFGYEKEVAAVMQSDAPDPE